jgi:hypothetical protein
MNAVSKETRTVRPKPAICRRANLPPETLLQAIGRLRKEAADEIERLLEFLDRTEPDPDLEESDPSGIADYEGLIEQTGRQDWMVRFYV